MHIACHLYMCCELDWVSGLRSLDHLKKWRHWKRSNIFLSIILTVGVSNHYSKNYKYVKNPWMLLISGNSWGKLIDVGQREVGRSCFGEIWTGSCQIFFVAKNKVHLKVETDHLFSDSDLFLSNGFNLIFINDEKGNVWHGFDYPLSKSLTQEHELPDHFTEKSL